jgi:hypothetical protein
MRFNRALGPLAVAVIALSACEPAKYELMPLEAAKYHEPKPLVAQTLVEPAPRPGFPEGAVRVADAIWVATETEYRLPETFVRPVATLDGLMFHSFAWDQQPFDILLVRSPTAPGSWVEFNEIF